mgnify:CR=1 FL=1
MIFNELNEQINIVNDKLEQIDEDKLNQLQYNLIRSHSAGTGNILDEEYVRAVLIARINNFLQANSGISLGVIEKLVEFLNERISPEIYDYGI